MADEREGHVDRGRPAARVQSPIGVARASRSSPPVRSPTCCSRCCCSPERYVAGVPGQRALLAEPPASTRRAAADVRAGDRVVGVDGEPVGSWQELRWRIVRAQGNDRIALSLVRDNARPRARSRANCRSPALGTDDWEGNPLADAWLARRSRRADRRPGAAGQAGRARGARQRRPDSSPSTAGRCARRATSRR